MAFESHTRFQAPDGCAVGAERQSVSVLARWIVDDDDLATAWRETYGPGVESGDILVERAAMAADWITTTLRWPGDGFDAVHSTVLAAGETTLREGMLVPTPQGVHVVDLTSASAPPEGLVPVALRTADAQAGTLSINLETSVAGTWAALDAEACR